MKVSEKSIVIKKRRKKKKHLTSSESIKPVVNPKLFDGTSNWLVIQKLVASDKSYGNSSTKEKSQNSYKKFNHTAVSNGIPAYHSSNLENHSVKTGVTVKHKTVSSETKLDAVTALNNKKMYRSVSFSDLPAEENPAENGSNCSTNGTVSKAKTNGNILNETGGKRITKAVAMDCEMVGTGPKGEESIIARVSIVNSYGDCLYDEFVKPKEKVTDFRTHVSGVRPSDLKKGKDLYEVQKEVLNIVDGKILVGHSLKHDLEVLFMSHPRALIRDTSNYKPFRDLFNGRTPSLKKLTDKILGCEIQTGEHSSVEDAQATMLLYLRNKSEWEKSLRKKRNRNKTS